jgi:acetone carboxylase alpha subunit
MILPIFHKGKLVCWVASTVHEGENGAIEPGGMPSMAESPSDEGLKMCPFKVVENYQIKRDIMTFLQNSVREPKLQLRRHEGRSCSPAMRMESAHRGNARGATAPRRCSPRCARRWKTTAAEVRSAGSATWPDMAVRTYMFPGRRRCARTAW